MSEYKVRYEGKTLALDHYKTNTHKIETNVSHRVSKISYIHILPVHVIRMSEQLTGTGGSITIDNNSVYIGDWEITKFTGLYGFSGWKGRALLKKESRLVGTAEGVFEMKGKTYHGRVIVNHSSRNWSRRAVEDRATITFRGDGVLLED
jgi:hypothetical protein